MKHTKNTLSSDDAEAAAQMREAVFPENLDPDLPRCERCGTQTDRPAFELPDGTLLGPCCAPDIGSASILVEDVPHRDW